MGQGAYVLGLSTPAVYTRVGRLLYQKELVIFTAKASAIAELVALWV